MMYGQELYKPMMGGGGGGGGQGHRDWTKVFVAADGIPLNNVIQKKDIKTIKKQFKDLDGSEIRNKKNVIGRTTAKKLGKDEEIKEDQLEKKEEDDDDNDDEEPKLDSVIRAAEFIPEGKVIENGDIYETLFPEDLISDDMITDAHDALKKMALEDIKKDVILTEDIIGEAPAVVCAAHVIDAGSIIRRSDLDWAMSNMVTGAMYQNMNAVIGKRAKRKIDKDIIITSGMLL